MKAVDIIIKKRDHSALCREEIQFFVEGITKGSIPDYQAAAWAMAILLNGMTDIETTDLTMAMAHSGDILDLSSAGSVIVDKHSTGGVGDKTTFVVEPVVAACGLPVGKMSGRSLGFSGGTLDKIESIPGYRTDLSTEEFICQLKQIGLVLTGQSADLAPADGKLYALRDVTGTVPSMPLIASSVMSKKIAAGANAIVLDVKTGLGAFMQTLEEARELARIMVAIGKLSGRKVVAVLSDMNQPLGNAVGNALELREAIETLHGNGPADFRDHCLLLSSHLLMVGGMTSSIGEGRLMAEKTLSDGKAYNMFRTLVKAQGGDVAFIDEPDRLPHASLVEIVPSPRKGYLTMIHAREVGEASVDLGAGRAKKSDSIDHAVGIMIHQKVGVRIEIGDPLFTIHANSEEKCRLAKDRLLLAHQWSDEPCQPLPVSYGVIS